MLQSSPCTSPPIDCKIMGAGIDRLPFSGMPSDFQYTTSVEACQIQNTKSKSAGFPALFDILSNFSSVLKFCVFFFFPVPPCDDFRLPYREFFHERLLNKPDSQPVNQRTSAKYSAYTTDWNQRHKLWIIHFDILTHILPQEPAHGITICVNQKNPKCSGRNGIDKRAVLYFYRFEEHKRTHTNEHR